MRLLLDQTLDRRVADALRRDGHDVLRASDVGEHRADDAKILDLARKDNRVLVTLDHHFGDWAGLPLGQPPGVIRVRTKAAVASQILEVLQPILNATAQEAFRSHLVIATRARCRWIRTAGRLEVQPDALTASSSAPPASDAPARAASPGRGWGRGWPVHPAPGAAGHRAGLPEGAAVPATARAIGRCRNCHR